MHPCPAKGFHIWLLPHPWIIFSFSFKNKSKSLKRKARLGSSKVMFGLPWVAQSSNLSKRSSLHSLGNYFFLIQGLHYNVYTFPQLDEENVSLPPYCFFCCIPWSQKVTESTERKLCMTLGNEWNASSKVDSPLFQKWRDLFCWHGITAKVYLESCVVEKLDLQMCTSGCNSTKRIVFFWDKWCFADKPECYLYACTAPHVQCEHRWLRSPKMMLNGAHRRLCAWVHTCMVECARLCVPELVCEFVYHWVYVLASVCVCVCWVHGFAQVSWSVSSCRCPHTDSLVAPLLSCSPAHVSSTQSHLEDPSVPAFGQTSHKCEWKRPPAMKARLVAFNTSLQQSAVHGPPSISTTATV